MEPDYTNEILNTFPCNRITKFQYDKLKYALSLYSGNINKPSVFINKDNELVLAIRIKNREHTLILLDIVDMVMYIEFFDKKYKLLSSEHDNVSVNSLIHLWATNSPATEMFT